MHALQTLVDVFEILNIYKLENENWAGVVAIYAADNRTPTTFVNNVMS